MPTSARTLPGFFGQCADVGIRAPEQKGLLQQALTSLAGSVPLGLTFAARFGLVTALDSRKAREQRKPL